MCDYRLGKREAYILPPSQAGFSKYRGRRGGNGEAGAEEEEDPEVVAIGNSEWSGRTQKPWVLAARSR